MTKYKHVYTTKINGKQYFIGKVGKYKKQGFKTDREAALWVDKRLIEAGKDPVNILKKVK